MVMNSDTATAVVFLGFGLLAVLGFIGIPIAAQLVAFWIDRKYRKQDP